MNKDGVKKLMLQIGEVRRWFYLGSRDTFGVDITGIVLPREPMTIIDERDHDSPFDRYDYLEPTEYERELAIEKAQQKRDAYVEPPRIHHAMARLLHGCVQYMEMRLEQAETGGPVQGMASLERNLEHFLKEVEKEARNPPFHDAKDFVGGILHHARIAHRLATSDRPMTFEAAELAQEREQGARR